MVVLVMLSTALLLCKDRVSVAQKEREDQDGQKQEFVVENEHGDGAKTEQVIGDGEREGDATVVG